MGGILSSKHKILYHPFRLFQVSDAKVFVFYIGRQKDKDKPFGQKAYNRHQIKGMDGPDASTDLPPKNHSPRRPTKKAHSFFPAVRFLLQLTTVAFFPFFAESGLKNRPDTAILLFSNGFSST